MWLIGPIRPIVAITAVSASSSGTPAATRAPNAISRISRVIGSEVNSACLKSSLIESLICLLTLASPDSPIVKSGLAACAALTASSAGPTRSCVSVSSPAILKRSRAERPSAEICPLLPGA